MCGRIASVAREEEAEGNYKSAERQKVTVTWHHSHLSIIHINYIILSRPIKIYFNHLPKQINTVLTDKAQLYFS